MIPILHIGCLFHEYLYLLNYNIFHRHGEEWSRKRLALSAPLHQAISQHVQGMHEITDTFTNKVYNHRNPQDELTKDLYREIHKWAFDNMGEFYC